MVRPPIALLVTDVDNTLFDWVSSWAICAPYLVNAVSQHLGVDAGEAERRIRGVHRAWGVTECPSCVGEIITDPPACHAIVREYEARFARTAPIFTGVPAALRRVRGRGARIVAYTESHRGHTWRRLQLLGISGLVDAVYADRRKPDPGTLRRIASDAGVQGSRVLYVGDNLWKDVSMAQRAGVHAAWARYGTHRAREADRWLDRLCHWTMDDVAAEHVAASAVGATIVLEHGLAELFDRFTFVPHDGFRQPDDHTSADSARTQ